MKKILSLLIAGIMLFGQGLNVCLAAPQQHHNDRPAQHRWYNFWHRDNDKPAAKRKAHKTKKHKIKKKNSNHNWLKWRKNKQNINKKHRNKRYEKNKKHTIKNITNNVSFSGKITKDIIIRKRNS